MQHLSDDILKKAQRWLDPLFDATTQSEVTSLLAGDPERVEDAFYKSLAFGTGGMRGIMGPGDNRINKYTLGKATQGLAQYMHQVFPTQDKKVVIAYDCRHNSKALAQMVAQVFAANNIEAFVFSDLRPTPELSFAVRHLGCQCGIVLTASHNPPQYNGYKVYWQDGGQLVPPQDAAIIQRINALDYADIKFDASEHLIHQIDQEVDQAFIGASLAAVTQQTTSTQREDLKIVFTPLHGTSITMVPPVLEKAGFKGLSIVAAQAVPDGDFPTVKSPNPEEPEALALAMEQAEREQADLVIGTDPDCDRLGIAVRDDQGQLQLLDGNQAMIVKTHFLLEQYRKAGKLDQTFIASTIVSTPMMRVLADHYGVTYREGLTGFKWIAKMVKDFPQEHFIGGGEESFGYMVGDFVRDKDAVTASLLICEIAAFQKAQGTSIWAYLQSLYKKHGYFQEVLISMVKQGRKGAEEIEDIMKSLREQPPKELGGSAVRFVEDYQTQTQIDLTTGVQTPLGLPQSNVLIFNTEKGGKIAARPSGTEPKIKFYISVRADDAEGLAPQIQQIKTDLRLV
jgi:phosphoglucomutase